MTAEQYWDGDPWLAKAFREANELRKGWDNEMAWLQGMYIYQALCAASPLFRAFAKKGTKAQPYIEQPIPITKRQGEDNKVEQEKQTFEKGKKFMEIFALNHNKRFAKTEVKQSGADH